MAADKDLLGQSLTPLFQLLMRMERSRETQTDADKLYRQCCTEVDRFQARAKELELSPAEAENGVYALVALIDETAVNADGAINDF